MLNKEKIERAAAEIKASSPLSVFTGAGISVESGIPPFRGEDGLWSKYNPEDFSFQSFLERPKSSWELYREIFYSLFEKTGPNLAHKIIAEWEKKGWLQSVITQNIDGLHEEAGSRTVFKIHGTYKELICIECGNIIPFKKSFLEQLPPSCDKCGGLLKPNFILFGENLPEKDYEKSLQAARNSRVFLVIGTTGEVFPAGRIPEVASRNNSLIVEINTDKSSYTANITDIFLQGKATTVMEKLNEIMLENDF